MQKFKIFSVVSFAFLLMMFFVACPRMETYASVTVKKYYTIYDGQGKDKILFLKGDEVSVGDQYLSGDNKFYEIKSVDTKNKTAVAEFVRDEKLPEVKLKNQDKNVASAVDESKKIIGVYHTHNDESYYTPDGIDSIYGKGGIHDVGASFVKNLKNLGVQVLYREDLHLPHNSGAYTRSQVTASALLNDGAQAIFDLHRDSTKRSEYLTTVDGKQMSSVRMVIGASSKNYEENKKFAYTIKAYADQTYPGLIKDIYIGKGNYNQQLTTRAMLFEMGCENIEKDLVLKTTDYLAKTVDVVLYGTESDSNDSLSGASVSEILNGGASNVSLSGKNSTVNSNDTLWVVLGTLGVIGVTFALVMVFSKNARYKVSRFFSEMFAGIFGKKKI